MAGIQQLLRRCKEDSPSENKIKKCEFNPWNHCYEEICIIRDASEEESKILKSIIYLCGFHTGVVAGGYAAWVNGVTNSYNDIDLFFKESRYRFFTTRSRSYRFANINRIERDGFYEQIFINYEEEWLGISEHASLQLFLKHILKGFDIPECKVGYYYNKVEKKFVCVKLQTQLNNEAVLALNVDRMIRYNKRCKNVPTLKWLAVTACKKHNVENLKSFIQSINIILHSYSFSFLL